MMRTREQNEELVKKLTEISESINKQIPLAANRFDEFECVHLDPDLPEEEKQKIFDEVDAKYFAHEITYSTERMKFRVFQHINLLFQQYLDERTITNPSQLSEEDCAHFQKSLTSQTANIIAKIHRQNQLLGENISNVDYSFLEAYLDINKANFVSQLMASEKLVLENPEYQKRCELTDRLVELRDMEVREFIVNKPSLLLGFDDTVKKKMLQYQKVWRGIFFDRVQTDTGFCDEFSSIGLKRILESDIRWDLNIEVIHMQYLDDEGKVDDGHVFLAINRDKLSELNNITTWGKDAILFDPWNKLVCLAEDYQRLPIHYFSFPSGAKWEVGETYTYDDRCLLHMVQNIDRLYGMTGNTNMEQRIPRLHEEYTLFSLKNDLTHTRRFINRQAKKLKPDNFNFNVEFFITTEGNKLINPIAGFKEPKIAIHQDFLLNMNGKEDGYTLEEFKFALAQSLVYIQRHWAGMNDINATDQYLIDNLAILKSKNGNAAISFLRKQIKFNKEHKSESVGSVTMFYSDWRMTKADDDERIKALMTMFASDQYKYLTTEKNNTPLTIPEISVEIAPLRREVFFEKALNQVQNKIQQIEYLTSQLPQLKIELFPYEMYSSKSVRVRDYCRLLRQLKINLNKPAEFRAAERLINKAYQLRVPAFEQIYFAVHGKELKDYVQSQQRVLRPIGVFAELQNTIDQFIHAKTVKQALSAIDQFEAKREELKWHMDARAAGIYLTEKFEKEHHGQVPQGDQRFFGSDLGEYMLWHSFHIKKNKPLPWLPHLQLVKQDPSHRIARALWMFGVQHYEPLWRIIPPIEVIRLEDYVLRPFVKVSGYQWYTVSDDWKVYKLNLHQSILDFLFKTHSYDDSMLRLPLSFREKFQQFYDANWPKLIFPESGDRYSFSRQHNTNNQAVHTLLRMLKWAAFHGSKKDKQVVKDFYLDKDGKYTIARLLNFEFRYGAHLEYKTEYMRFLFDQDKDGRKHYLFSADELASCIKDKDFMYTFEIPGDDWRKIFNMPFTSMTLDCLEQLFPIFIKNKLDVQFYCLQHHMSLFKHPAFSAEALRLMRLTYDRAVFISSLHSPTELIKSPHFTWEMESTSEDIVYLYRAYDNCYAFPNITTKIQAGELVISVIEKEKSDKQIDMLQSLLKLEGHLFPLTDVVLRNKVVNKWVKLILAKYGKDDNTADYYERLVKLIREMDATLSKRDKVYVFEKLASTIETQRKLSDFIGVLVDKRRFLDLSNEKDMDGAWQLAKISKFLSVEKQDQKEFLDFLTAPISEQSLDRFATYIERHGKLSEFIKEVDSDYKIYQNRSNLIFIMHTLHFNFWSCTLEQRAIMIDHLLIPASKVTTDKDIATAYSDGFAYIAPKLFPNAGDPNSDEHFALSLMQAYLDTADKYQRGILLAGMLVAHNESLNSHEQFSSGKKIALMCEHMGPAYIKLAQAVHSHPGTPEHIRHDLSHIKGRANPPHRWDLWKLIAEVLPEEQRDKIKHVGRLLGSASYNLALEITTTVGDEVVLLLLRENARKDAAKGFAHLKATIEICQHARMLAIRSALLSILEEAKLLSHHEMDKTLSEQQYAIAADIYPTQGKIEDFTYQVSPVKLFNNGEGYRFIERVYGVEFNHLPSSKPNDKKNRQLIAQVIVKLELERIFSGSHFDSDRHGNQLRVKVDKKNKSFHLGLYDFGEMMVEKPDKQDIQYLVRLIPDIAKKITKSATFSEVCNSTIAEYIDEARKNNHPTHYLGRVRKAFLALQDFMKELSNDQIIVILKQLSISNKVDVNVRQSLRAALPSDVVMTGYQVAQGVANSIMSLFSRMRSQAPVTGFTSLRTSIQTHTTTQSSPSSNHETDLSQVLQPYM